MMRFFLFAIVCVLGVAGAACHRVVDGAEPAFIRLSWPFAPDSGARLYQTYGQAERIDWIDPESSSVNVHHGLDITAPAGTPVYAPMSGQATILFAEGMKSYTRGIAIRQIVDGKELVVELLHLEESSIQLALGDFVQRGDLLGELAEWPAGQTYLPHLHLAVGHADLDATDDGSGNPRGFLRFVESRNPLTMLEAPEDLIAPRGVAFAQSGTPFSFFEATPDEDIGWVRGPALDPRKLSGLVDFDIAVIDFERSTDGLPLAPLELRVEITAMDHAAPPVARRIRFDKGSYAKGDADYVMYQPSPPSDPAFVFRFAVFAKVDGRVRDLEGLAPWDTRSVQPGRYRVTAHAFDGRHRALVGETEVNVVHDAPR